MHRGYLAHMKHCGGRHVTTFHDGEDGCTSVRCDLAMRMPLIVKCISRHFLPAT